ncbi:MAG: DNA-directed RNA polymerase subunit D [Candidatus Aenigmatarchaeota archaeon]
MDVKVLEKSERAMRVRIEGIDFAMANALRRIMMGEIPVMAIEHVDIVSNSSGLVDETLAHRLGLLPLKWPDGRYNLPSECGCKGKGCSKCQAAFTLEKSGPATVRAADLVPEDKDVAPMDANVPIVELLENQSIKLTALAQLGLGREHAKWQAAIVGYEQRGNAFTFSIESTCGLSAAEVFEKALDVLAAQADEFAKAAKKELK